MVIEVNERNFEEEVLKSELPVLVDFWAAWCGPCRSMAPIVDQVADEFAGRVKVAKLNVDENLELAQRYGIRGIPTLLFFQRGKVVAQEVGYTPKETVVQKLHRLFGVE
ncbi:MAG: thioredoxin [Thermodesulfitimonas sp.]